MALTGDIFLKYINIYISYFCLNFYIKFGGLIWLGCISVFTGANLEIFAFSTFSKVKAATGAS